MERFLAVATPNHGPVSLGIAYCAMLRSNALVSYRPYERTIYAPPRIDFAAQLT
jgi:hypothetical protein